MSDARIEGGDLVVDAQRQPDTARLQLLGIYDADGGIVGELRYVVGHLLGTAECALCDITHSPFRRKPEWDRMVAELDMPFTVVHRNEVPDWAASAAASASLPSVLARTLEGRVVELVGAAELAACEGSVTELRSRLARRMAQFA